MNIKTISLDTLDLSLQTRESTNTEVASEYSELMREGDNFPAITVFADGDHTYLIDGFHRVAAAKALGIKELPAEFLGGDFAAALIYAFKANSKHGLRRTNADKRHALELAWANRDVLFKGERMTERLLAEICCVSKTLCHDFMQHMGLVEKTKTEEKDGPSERAVKKNLKEGNDRFGVKIPEPILPVFKSRDLKELLKGVRKVRAEIAKHFEVNDVAFSALGQQVLINLDNAANNIRFATPHCVCRTCRGDGCYRCKDRGFMTLMQYNALPSEFKAKGEIE